MTKAVVYFPDVRKYCEMSSSSHFWHISHISSP